MNSYHVTQLVTDHMNELHAEAQRQRLARTAKASKSRRASSRNRSPRRLRWGLLFGRAAA